MPVESLIAGKDRPVLPRRRSQDLTGLATFVLDASGQVVSWPVTAARLFGHLAPAVTGQDVRDVLMTGPGQRELICEALAAVAAGGGWAAPRAQALPRGGGPGGARP